MSIHPLYRIFYGAETKPKSFSKKPSIAGKLAWLQNSSNGPQKKSLCIPYSFNDVAEICFLQHFLSPSEVVCLHFSSVLKWQVREGGGMYKQESRLKWSSIWNKAQARHKNTLTKDTYNLYLPLHIHLINFYSVLWTGLTKRASFRNWHISKYSPTSS